jgi:hypothetical protein
MIHAASIKLWKPAPNADPRLTKWLQDVLGLPILTDMTDFLENATGQFFLRNNADTFTPAVTIYMALFTAATADTGVYTNEVANSNGYARTSFTFDAWSGTTGLQDNPSNVTFPAASGGNWGTITHAAIVDSATHAAGNMLLHSALDSSVIINDGDTFQFPAGDINCTFA